MSDRNTPKNRMPDWVPENAGSKFTSRIVSGTKSNKDPILKKPINDTAINVNPDINYLLEGVLASNRTVLSKAITLIESNSAKHFEQAQELIRNLIPYAGKSLRIGITGVPGSGKSTFIEYFGTWLINKGHKVAVLAIDPSSTISKGSILGDKTRMEKLSRLDGSFIRPSPSSGVLGGVARKSRETIIACEAAGYDIILIETVGVGQSEVTVRSIVDFFILLQITGAGDELQGIKKGIMELADLIAVNKADGDNISKAEVTRNDINQVLHYLQPVTVGWETKAVTCSSFTGAGINSIWESISEFQRVTKLNGTFEKRRTNQMLQWLDTMLLETLTSLFYNDADVSVAYDISRKEILSGKVSPAIAAKSLINLYKKTINLDADD